MITAIEIEHFKGFYKKQKVEFAIPDKKNPGSGLTILTGPNNSGKTTAIEALTLTPDKSFKMTERHDGKGKPRIKISSLDGGHKEFTNIRDGSLIKMTTQGGATYEIDLISSRRTWNAEFSGEADIMAIRSQSITDSKNAGQQLAQVLAKIYREKKKYDKFTKMMQGLVPHFSKWDVDTLDNNNRVIKYYSGSNAPHIANLLGDGIISLFRICAHLIEKTPNTTIIIDEPELSLHPTAQKRLRKLLSEISKDFQIIVSTHSPYFVDWHDFMNGARLVRFNKYGDKKCSIKTLNNKASYASKLTIEDWQKPHLLDTVAKEVFFSEKVLILEGQQDVGIIRAWISNKKVAEFDIFGHGAGGETNIPIYLELCKDLGIDKVCAIFDKNATQYASSKKKYKKYKIFQLSTNDIVDKDAQKVKKAVVGSFGKDGSLKKQYSKSFQGLFSKIEKYYIN